MTLAPLAWVPWVPWNPSIFEQWVLEPINCGKRGVKFTLFSLNQARNRVSYLEIAFGNLPF